MTTPEEPDAPVSDATDEAVETEASAPEETEGDVDSRALPEERHSRTTELAARLRQSALAQVEAARTAGTAGENEPATPPAPVIPALDEPSYRITDRPAPSAPLPTAEPAPLQPLQPLQPLAEIQPPVGAAETAATDSEEDSGEAAEPESESAAEPETATLTHVATEAATGDDPAHEPEPLVVDSTTKDAADTSYLSGPLEPVEPGRGGWLPLATSAMALLTVAAVVLLVIFTHSASHNSAVAKARVAALAAAKTETAAALTYNYQTLDADFAHAEAGMSKAFRANYAQTAASSVEPLATKTHAVTTGQVVAGGVISASADKAEVLVFANQTVENKLLNATSRLDRSVIQVSMIKQDGHWVINDLKPF